MGGREPLAVRAAASPVLARIATASAVGGLPLARSVDNGRSSPGTGRTPRARCRAGDARTRVLRHRPRSQPGHAGGNQFRRRPRQRGRPQPAAGWTPAALRRSLRARHEHPSGPAARGAGYAVVKVHLRRAVLVGPPTRPAAQRRGLPCRLLPTGPRSFRPAGAPLRKQSWSGRPPPALPAPERSSLPDEPEEWVEGHDPEPPAPEGAGCGRHPH